MTCVAKRLQMFASNWRASCRAKQTRFQHPTYLEIPMRSVVMTNGSCWITTGLLNSSSTRKNHNQRKGNDDGDDARTLPHQDPRLGRRRLAVASRRQTSGDVSRPNERKTGNSKPQIDRAGSRRADEGGENSGGRGGCG